MLLVSAESTTAAIERARTAMTTSGAGITMYPVTRNDNATVTAQAMENQFATLAYIGILIAASVSTVSLGVSTIASLLARRQVLGVLRLMGMPPSVLRATVAYETVLPVSTVLLADIGLGVLTAWAVIHALTTSRTVGWPGASYCAVILTCLALVGLAVAASARAARTMARGTVRFE